MNQETPQSLNWEQVELETVNPHMQRRIVTGKRMTVARIYFKEGFLVPLHSHVHEQITQVISGRMRFAFGDDRSEVVEYGPGDIVVIPSNLPHEALCLSDVEEMDMWTPRRDDWLDGSDDYLRA
jgi:quercetin dioxygenase-like cupin family protein